MKSPWMTKPPFLRHPFVVPTTSSPPPMDDPATSRGQLRRRNPPRTPALGPEPRRKSAAVHRGNPALPEVSAQPGTICPGALTQEQRCQETVCETPGRTAQLIAFSHSPTLLLAPLGLALMGEQGS
ncbi:hypothetical protein NQZ68_034380 [Dissostichus eleginoides]|nr:hypothetical protein NQZ68_034380 [Dissostichus eleginoides]